MAKTLSLVQEHPLWANDVTKEYDSRLMELTFLSLYIELVSELSAHMSHMGDVFPCLGNRSGCQCM